MAGRTKKITVPTPISSHTHVDTRPNIPTEEMCTYERWASIEIVNLWDAKITIRALLKIDDTFTNDPLFDKNH